jgi:hypothetical protein
MDARKPRLITRTPLIARLGHLRQNFLPDLGDYGGENWACKVMQVGSN